MSYEVRIVGEFNYADGAAIDKGYADLEGEADTADIDLLMEGVARAGLTLHVDFQGSVPASTWQCLQSVVSILGGPARDGYVDCVWLEDEPHGERVFPNAAWEANEDLDDETPDDVVARIVADNEG